MAEFNTLLSSMKLSIVAVTETWLDSSIPSSVVILNDNSYTIFRKDRNRHGGGVMLAISNGLQPTAVDLPDTQTEIEIVFVQLAIGSEKWLCGAYYRPPSLDSTSIDDLENVMSHLDLDSFTGVILMGDFNIDWSPSNTGHLRSTLEKLTDATCLDQLVHEVTRSSADFSSNTILDLIFTSRPDRLRDVCIEAGIGNSDHNMVTFKIRGSPGKLPKLHRELYQYHNTDIDHFHNLISMTSWDLIDYSDIDKAWSEFTDLFFACVRECIPQRRCRRKVKPWITGELHKLIKEKRRLFKKARRSRTEGVWNRYKLIRNKVRIAYKKAYSDYVTQLFKKKDNRKSFWSFVKNKRKSSDAADSFSVNGAKIQDPGKIANGFNGFFASFFTTPSDACCNTACPCVRFSSTHKSVCDKGSDCQ